MPHPLPCTDPSAPPTHPGPCPAMSQPRGSKLRHPCWPPIHCLGRKGGGGGTSGSGWGCTRGAGQVTPEPTAAVLAPAHGLGEVTSVLTPPVGALGSISSSYGVHSITGADSGLNSPSRPSQAGVTGGLCQQGPHCLPKRHRQWLPPSFPSSFPIPFMAQQRISALHPHPACHTVPTHMGPFLGKRMPSYLSAGG